MTYLNVKKVQITKELNKHFYFSNKIYLNKYIFQYFTYYIMKN